MSEPTFVAIIDPLSVLKPEKDSTIAMLESAQHRAWKIGVIEADHLSWSQTTGVVAQVKWIRVDRHKQPWYEIKNTQQCALSQLTVVLLRKDPPFDAEYVTLTWLLDRAEAEGALILNRPSAVRDHNEKFAIASYPDLTAPTLVSKNQAQLKDFLQRHEQAICKPLEGMGGESIFRLSKTDPNVGVILETLTLRGKKTVMIQKYIPEISQGDKRILLINGEPAPFVLARIPKQGEHRGNLAAGGTARAQPLSDVDHQIALKVGPALAKKGLFLIGLDVIGHYLTEINVTSPTCFREIQEQTGYSVADSFVQSVEALVAATPPQGGY